MSSRATPATLPLARVLIVEDDGQVRRALEMRLRAAGLETIACAHPEEATLRILRERPDLILLDIGLPRFSGLEPHETLKCTDRGRDIPIVYLSGDASPANRRDAFRRGARAFVAKPFDSRELVATVLGILDACPRGGAALRGTSGTAQPPAPTAASSACEGGASAGPESVEAGRVEAGVAPAAGTSTPS